MQVSRLLPKITKALYSSLPCSHFCLTSQHPSHYQTKWENHWYSRGWGYDKYNIQQGKVAGGVPSVGDMDIFWNDTFEPGVTESGQWLVKYSISETPHCLLLLFYFDKQEICNLPSRIITYSQMQV